MNGLLGVDGNDCVRRRLGSNNEGDGMLVCPTAAWQSSSTDRKVSLEISLTDKIPSMGLAPGECSDVGFCGKVDPPQGPSRRRYSDLG